MCFDSRHKTFIFQEASRLPTGPTYPAIRGAPTALHWGNAAGSLSRLLIYKVLRLMSEAASSPVHTLHGVYKDNFNLHSIRQVAIGGWLHAQLSLLQLPGAAQRLCYSPYSSSPITLKVRPHRTRSAAADCGLCPLRNVTF